MSRTITAKNLATIVIAAALSVTAPTAWSNDEIIRLSQNDENWVMQCKDQACARYRK